MGVELEPFHEGDDEIRSRPGVRRANDPLADVVLQLAGEVVPESFEHGFEPLPHDGMAEAQIVEPEVDSRIDGSGPFQGEQGVHKGREAGLSVRDVVEAKEFGGLVLFDEQIHQLDGHVLLGLEVVDDQAGVDAHALGDLADGSPFEAFAREDLVVGFQDFPLAGSGFAVLFHGASVRISFFIECSLNFSRKKTSVKGKSRIFRKGGKEIDCVGSDIKHPFILLYTGGLPSTSPKASTSSSNPFTSRTRTGVPGEAPCGPPEASLAFQSSPLTLTLILSGSSLEALSTTAVRPAKPSAGDLTLGREGLTGGFERQARITSSPIW